MNQVLKEILDHKKNEVEKLKREGLSERERYSEKREFAGGIKSGERISVISEIKKASPSKGIISGDFDPVGRALDYERGGACAVSVLTDSKFFMGSIEYLKNVRKAVSLPVLRKDFIIDPVQVEESFNIGADAVLIIAAALSDFQMEEIYSAASEFGLDSLLEIHDFGELERVMSLEPELIGINNRNLDTFETDINVTKQLAPEIPDGISVVSESGIFSSEDVSDLAGSGISGILVGESLMKSGDPAAMIEKLSIPRLKRNK